MNSDLNIENFMSIPEVELQELNGGNPFLIAIAVVFVAQMILDWDNFKNGITGHPEESRNIQINF